MLPQITSTSIVTSGKHRLGFPIKFLLTGIVNETKWYQNRQRNIQELVYNYFYIMREDRKLTGISL